MNHFWSTLFAVLAGVIHVYIFALESLLWSKPRTRKLFGIREDAQLEATKNLAFNQGFYNLFLAVAIGVGLALGETGVILVQYAMASIFAAGLVLLNSNRKMLRAALIQIVPTALYFIFWFVF